MKARDVMTSAVVSVGPDTPTREIAKILRDHGISAVPVIDAAGAPIGMVSEGDLIGRDEAEREARRDWWLTLLAEGGTLNPDFVASLGAPERTARDIMAAPVITIGEDTEICDIARSLTDVPHKAGTSAPRRPDGRHRESSRSRPCARQRNSPEASRRRRRRAGRGAGGARSPTSSTRIPPPSPRRSSTIADGRTPGPTEHPDFRGLMADHGHKELREHSQDLRRAAAQQRRDRVAELIDHHISDENWRSLLHRARQSAEQGEKEFMLLRFPSPLCSDGGRAINISETGWSETLRGEAGELYLRWERDLKPQGFPLGARVLDFPGGMPGDVGLFLFWGQ